MNDSFNILDAFVSHFSPEVEGRRAEAIDSETRNALQRLCRGELSEAERQEAAKVLISNPTAMEFLLSEISTFKDS
ncbi:MAG: hypothetical protein AAGA58_10360 [Verrucomicrobiota bacterium]